MLGSGMGKAAGSVRSRRNRGDRESLGEGEPEIEGERGKRDPAVDDRRTDGRAAGKAGDASRAGGNVVGNGAADGGAMVVAKTKGNEIVDEKESREKGGAATTGFDSGVARAAGNAPKGSDQLS